MDGNSLLSRQRSISFTPPASGASRAFGTRRDVLRWWRYASQRPKEESVSINYPLCVLCTREKNFPFFHDTGGQESRVHAFEAGREETRLRPRPLLDRPLGSCNGDPSVSRAAKCPEYEMRATAAETEDGVQPCCDATWRLRIGCRKLSLSAENTRSRETFQLYDWIVLLQKRRESPVRIWHSSVRLRSPNWFTLVYVFVFIENLIVRSRLNPYFVLNFLSDFHFLYFIPRGLCLTQLFVKNLSCVPQNNPRPDLIFCFYWKEGKKYFHTFAQRIAFRIILF